LQNQSNVAPLSGERGSTTTTQKGSTIFASQRGRGDDIFPVTREDHADGNLAIIGAIGGIERATRGIKTYVATYSTAQSLSQGRSIDRRRLGGARECCARLGHVGWVRWCG